MTDKIKALFIEKSRIATERYAKRMDELFAEYSSKKSIEDKNKIIANITTLSRAYKNLMDAYKEAEESLAYNIQRSVTRYDEFFEAKLKNAPHEWDGV